MTPTDDPKFEVAPGDEPHLLSHNYDGIRELDHPLPRWWLMIFYATIVFSVFYAGYYMTGIGPSQSEEHSIAMKAIEAKRPPEAPAPVGGEDSLVLAAFKDPSRLSSGKNIYLSKCAACHGQNGEGGIGPNLTDAYWIHGQGSPGDVLTMVRKGVPEKGMPGWAELLKPAEQLEVTAFVRSLHGTNPPGAKAAQGELHETKEL